MFPVCHYAVRTRAAGGRRSGAQVCFDGDLYPILSLVRFWVLVGRKTMRIRLTREFGYIALTISVCNPILMLCAITFGNQETPYWAKDMLAMALWGSVAGLAFAAIGLIDRSKRTYAGLAFLLGLLDLAEFGLLYSR
jgi:hypothetical protein